MLAALVLEAALKMERRQRDARATGASSCPATCSIRRHLQAGGAVGDLRARRLHRGPARLLDVPGHRQPQGGQGRGLALVAEPQLREPHGRRLAGLARQRRDRRRQRAGYARGRPARPAGAGGSRPARRSILQRDAHRAPLPEITVSRAGDARRAAGGVTAARAAAGGSAIRARVQRFGDAVDTDAIIPGEFCHLTELDELGAKAFHYVRPEFARAREAGRDHRGRRRGLGQRQLARAGRLGAAGRGHPGDHRQELRLHPQAQSGQRGAAVSGGHATQRSTRWPRRAPSWRSTWRAAR